MAKRAIVQALCYGPIAPFLLGMLTSGVFQVFRSGGVKRRTSRDSCSVRSHAPAQGKLDRM